MISVRRAGVADAPEVGRFVDALVVELTGYPSRLDERLRTPEQLLALRDRFFGFLALERETPVGVMMLAESAAIYAGGWLGVIAELYVAPAHRSAGVAKRLLDAGIALMRERAWDRLEVGAPRQPAWERSLKILLAIRVRRGRSSAAAATLIVARPCAISRTPLMLAV